MTQSLLARILGRRGYSTPQAARGFLDPGAYTPAPACALPGMAEAVARLRYAIARGERVHVWGDFDADGQTAASVLVLGLRALGADVHYTIPDRACGRRGLNQAGITRAAEAGARVLLTCDCGVSDFDEIALARRLGLDVIVTDHHDFARLEDDSADEPAFRFPDAVAVVNPKRLPPGHALADLPGVGVAYKLIEGLSAAWRGPNSYDPRSLLDLVALGIVADVACLRADTRYLLQIGLRRLRADPRPGVRALLRAAGIEPANLEAEDIGYQLGPRLNAAGRLAQAEICVELLTTSDPARAQELADRIEALNEQRKALQRQVEQSAFEQIAHDPNLANRPVIVLASPDWDPSIIGVVAATVSNRHNRPAILISARPGEIGRGSARSANGFDIHAAIQAQGELVVICGGHPQAAGFAIRGECVDAFRDGVNAYATRLAPAEDPDSPDDPDAVVAWREVDLAMCEQLEQLAPFGCGNPRPVLKSEQVRVARVEPVGKDSGHLALHLADDAGNVARALWWRRAQSESIARPATGALCDVWFTLHRRVYRGRVTAQIDVVRVEPAGAG